MTVLPNFQDHGVDTLERALVFGALILRLTNTRLNHPVPRAENPYFNSARITSLPFNRIGQNFSPLLRIAFALPYDSGFALGRGGSFVRGVRSVSDFDPSPLIEIVCPPTPSPTHPIGSIPPWVNTLEKFIAFCSARLKALSYGGAISLNFLEESNEPTLSIDISLAFDATFFLVNDDLLCSVLPLESIPLHLAATAPDASTRPGLVVPPDPIVVSAAAPLNTAPLELITLSGSGLGGTSLKIKNGAALELTSQTPTEITFSFPSDTAHGAIRLELFRDGLTYEVPYDFLITPLISPLAIAAINPLLGVVGTVVTVAGTALDMVTSVSFGDSPIIPLSQSQNVIEFSAPDVLGGNYPITLTAAAESITYPTPFNLDFSSPLISSVVPNPFKIGELISITGRHLGGPEYLEAESPHGLLPVISGSFSTALIDTDSLPIGETTLLVSNFQNDSSNLFPITAESPVILTLESFSPLGGAVGSLITITGTNITGENLTLSLGGQNVSPNILSPTQLTVPVPALAAGTYSFLVLKDGFPVPLPGQFEVVPAVIGPVHVDTFTGNSGNSVTTHAADVATLPYSLAKIRASLPNPAAVIRNNRLEVTGGNGGLRMGATFVSGTIELVVRTNTARDGNTFLGFGFSTDNHIGITFDDMTDVITIFYGVGSERTHEKLKPFIFPRNASNILGASLSPEGELRVFVNGILFLSQSLPVLTASTPKFFLVGASVGTGKAFVESLKVWDFVKDLATIETVSPLPPVSISAVNPDAAYTQTPVEILGDGFDFAAFNVGEKRADKIRVFTDNRVFVYAASDATLGLGFPEAIVTDGSSSTVSTFPLTLDADTY